MSLGFRYLGDDGDAISSFDCGEAELDRFLRKEASRFTKQGLSAVRLLVDLDKNRIVGFYAISPMCVEKKKLSDAQRQMYNVPFPIPAWLIGRLAVDREYQKKGYGKQLLLDAMKNIQKRAERGAGALFIVDAKNEGLTEFYKKFGFTSLPSRRLRMFCPISYPA